MGQREYELGEAELQVLKALWDAGPATVREVMNRLHASGRRVAYTTVLTFLTRLEQKGYVRSNKSDLAYVYRAVASRTQVTRSRLKAVMDALFDGEAAPLVLQLMKTERFSPDELAELQRHIDQLEARTSAPSEGRGK